MDGHPKVKINCIFDDCCISGIYFVDYYFRFANMARILVQQTNSTEFYEMVGSSRITASS